MGGYNNLREFIDELRNAGELIQIDAKVSTNKEITELTDRQAKSEGGGKALLFTNTGYGFDVVTNTMGSMNRITRALRVSKLEELTGAIDAITGEMMRPRATIMDKLKLLPSLAKMGGIFPRNLSGKGDCQQVVLQGKDASLDILPALFCWPHDGGRFITLPLVTTQDPETGAPNLGMYRMQIFSKDRVGLHWHLHKTGERHWRKYKELGYDKMPVSIVIGGDPAYTYSATAPLPEGVSEYMLAGFIRQSPVKLVKSITNDLRVPADADFVIEGYIDLSEDKILEGPFGDHTGFYSLDDYYPQLHVTAITHRKDAIYPATIVGVPPQEDVYFAAATERIFLSPIRTVLAPEIRDMWLPDEGVAHNIAIVDIRKDFAGQPFKVASSMWGAGQMMFNKFILVTANGGDIRDIQMLAKSLASVNIERDVFMSRGPADVLDHSGVEFAFGGKLAIDASNTVDEILPLTIDRSKVTSSDIISFSSDVVEQYGLPLVCLYVDQNADFVAVAKEFIAASTNLKYLIILNKELEGTDLATHVWYTASNVDPMRDAIIEGGVLVMDGRTKHLGQNGFNRRWPNVVVMDDETILAIDSRWSEIMGDEKFIESPSHKYKKLVLSNSADY